MAAVLAPAPFPRLAPAPRLGPAARPHLRVLPGGKQAAPGRLVYWRRRLVAAVLVLIVLATAVVAVQRTAALVGGSIQADPPAGAVGALEPGATYVVQPGDTLWSIAGSLDPDGDVRPVVDELAHQLGGAMLYPGQRLDVSHLTR